MKMMTKSNQRRIDCLTLHHWGKTSLQHRDRSQCRNHGVMLLAGLHPMTALACFLTAPRISNILNGLCPLSSIINQKKYTAGLPTDTSDKHIFFNWGSFFQDDAILCQVDWKLTRVIMVFPCEGKCPQIVVKKIYFPSYVTFVRILYQNNTQRN